MKNICIYDMCIIYMILYILYIYMYIYIHIYIYTYTFKSSCQLRFLEMHMFHISSFNFCAPRKYLKLMEFQTAAEDGIWGFGVPARSWFEICQSSVVLFGDTHVSENGINKQTKKKNIYIYICT